jgi:hypothetical protein
MIELYMIVNELRGKYSISINVFDIDKAGGLKPVISFISLISHNYFILVYMNIIGGLIPFLLSHSPLYFTKDTLIRYSFPWATPEMMLLLGLIFSIRTQKIIRNLIENGKISEFEKINRKFKEIYDKIIEVSLNKKDNDDQKELEKLKIIMDLLEGEERKIKEITPKIFDSKTIINIITFLISLIAEHLSKIIKLFKW